MLDYKFFRFVQFCDLSVYISVDMLYLEFYCLDSNNILFDKLRSFCESNRFFYDYKLNIGCSSKYSFYNNYFFFNGIDIKFGKYVKKDRLNNELTISNYGVIRFNPNKYIDLIWFDDFIKIFQFDITESCISKYDIAIDFPCKPASISIPFSKKERGLYKGTRYLGQMGRNGYVKIYDKRKESKLEYDLCRVEYTFKDTVNHKIDNIYYKVSNSYILGDKLNDTDVAIVEMYRLLLDNNISYVLKLGRGKFDKISSCLYGSFFDIDSYFESDPIDDLLQEIKNYYNVGNVLFSSNEDDFYICIEDLPFY